MWNRELSSYIGTLMVLYMVGLVPGLYLQIKFHALMYVSYIHNSIMKPLPYIHSNPSHFLAAFRGVVSAFRTGNAPTVWCLSRRHGFEIHQKARG